MIVNQMRNLNDRIKAVIEFETSEFKRAGTLATLTAIAAESWKKFLAGKQKASIEMVQSICEKWPHYAFWIATGITDSRNGHVAPSVGYEKGSVNRKRLPRKFSQAYFKWKISIQKNEPPNIDWDTLLEHDPSLGSGYSRLDDVSAYNRFGAIYERAYLEWKNATETERERIDLEKLVEDDVLMATRREFYLRYSDPLKEEQFWSKINSGEIDDGQTH